MYVRRVLVFYDMGSVAPKRMAAAARDAGCKLVFLPADSEHARSMRRTLGLFGTVVDPTGRGFAEVVAELRALRPAGIVTFSETQLRPTARLAGALGLDYQSPADVHALTDKAEQRRRLRAAARRGSRADRRGWRACLRGGRMPGRTPGCGRGRDQADRGGSPGDRGQRPARRVGRRPGQPHRRHRSPADRAALRARRAATGAARGQRPARLPVPPARPDGSHPGRQRARPRPAAPYPLRRAGVRPYPGRRARRLADGVRQRPPRRVGLRRELRRACRHRRGDRVHRLDHLRVRGDMSDWYNIQADLDFPLPGDIAPAGDARRRLRVSIPPSLLRQERGRERWRPIPPEVPAAYAAWRPTPPRRAATLAPAIGTRSRI